MAASVGSAVVGDRGAIGRILAVIRPIVFRYCRARVGRHDGTFARADDLAQEACLAVLAALPSHREHGRPFLALVYDISARTVANVQLPTPRDGAEPDTRAGLSLQRADLLAGLPDNQREILILRTVVGLSTEETAEAMGATPGAIRAAQHRALTALRRTLTMHDVRDSEKSPDHRGLPDVATT